MASFSRPVLTSLLCGLVLLGHLPVWLHMASCDHESLDRASVAGVSAPEVKVCSHGCHHHHDSGDAASSSDTKPESPSDEHDHDSCFICQSMTAPNGVAWQFDSDAGMEYRVESTDIPAPIAAESISLSIPQPRGPPALV